MPDDAAKRRIWTGERGVYYRELARGARQYEVSYKDRHEKRRWELLPVGHGITAARALRAKRMTDGGPEAKPSRVTVAAVADAFMVKKRRTVARNTRDGYQRQIDNHIVPRFGDRPIGAIDTDDLAEFVADLSEEYAAWTVKAIWTPLVGIFAHALRRGIIAEDPCRRLEHDERPAAGKASLRYLDGDAEITRLLTAADERWQLLLAFAIFTGLRIGELLGLLWEDVDLRNGFVRVRAQRHTDGQRTDTLKSPAAHRDVVLLTELADVARAHLRAAEVTPHPKLPVFGNHTGRVPDRTTVRKGLRAACRDAGIEPLRFHDLRHTYASILIVDLARDPVTVARQLGHENPSTTLDTYAKLFDRARNAEDLRAQLDGRFAGLLRDLGGGA